MVSLRCVFRWANNAAETENAHAEQPPTEKTGSEDRDEVDNSRGNLIYRSLVEVIRNEVNATTGTLRASDDIVVVAIELLGCPHLEGGPEQGDDVKGEGGPNMRDRLCHEGCERHEEKPAVEYRCGNVLAAEEQ